MYVAILDDDDRWEPEHMELCFRAAVEGDLHMVASGILRHESKDAPPIKLSIANRLTVNDFLAGNPHIQGLKPVCQARQTA